MRKNGQTAVENESTEEKCKEISGKAETESKAVGMRITRCDGTKMECL
jgi:hypothetical protein